MGSYVDQRKIGRSGVFGMERKNPRQEGEIPNGPNVLGYPGAGLRVTADGGREPFRRVKRTES